MKLAEKVTQSLLVFWYSSLGRKTALYGKKSDDQSSTKNSAEGDIAVIYCTMSEEAV